VGVWRLIDCAMRMHPPAMELSLTDGESAGPLSRESSFPCLEHGPRRFSEESAELVVLSVIGYFSPVTYSALYRRYSDDDIPRLRDVEGEIM
jgi:hypothetical protein